MGVNPASELKRRLEDNAVPLAKRLCLARNVNDTRYLPTTTKERALVDWLDNVSITDEIVKSVLVWNLEEAGTELLGKLVEVISRYLQNHTQQTDLTENIIRFLENDRILSQLTSQIDSYLLIFRSLLTSLHRSEIDSKISLCERMFETVKKVYKNVTKKVDFVVKLIEGENLEVIFRCLNNSELRESSLKVCETVLFPITKKAHFSTFLQTLIRQESIDQLLEEKGDNIKAVVKVMSTFFTFPKDRTTKDAQFLIDYIDAFVTVFKSDSHLIFMFFIMAVNSLNIQQTYLNPAMSMPMIVFEEHDEKTKRNIILKSLECLKENDIDLNVKLTETLGEKLTKVEIKKNFSSFLQATIMSVLKLEGKPDKVTLKIITGALKLDPNIMEPKLDLILPNIMASKKNKNILDSYTEMLNCLLETLFKLSRGTEFIPRVLPLLKTQLEAINTEQFELKQQIEESLENEPNVDKIKAKIIVGEDLFPKVCVDKYGRLTSELMLKQYGELFVSLQKEFETHCLMLLEEGFVSPSLITLSEVLSAILSSVLAYGKMADHTVTAHIATEFWTNFKIFRDEFLTKYGQCVLNLSYNRQLSSSYLQLCHSYINLKLINARYGNISLEKDSIVCSKSTDIFDFSPVLPCLSAEQWIKLAKRILDNRDGDCVEMLNHLMLQKVIACDLYTSKETELNIKEYRHRLKTYLVTEINNIWSLIDNCPYYTNILLDSLDANQEQTLSKALVKRLESDFSVDILKAIAMSNNKTLQTCVSMETLKNILKVIEDEEFLKGNRSLRKAIKAGFEFEEVIKGSDVPSIFTNLSKSTNLNDEENQSIIAHNFDILKALQISTLDENTQLLSIFLILTVKNITVKTKAKKLKKTIDDLLLDIFEMSPKKPNLFKVFPIEFIFSFNNAFLTLLTLNRIKTSNRWIIIKSILESAVKKVKTNNEIIKTIVHILLKNKIKNDNTINFFSNEANQITCMILPIIAKEKKAITSSQYRSILAELQEKLHKFLLKSFKSINFETTGNSDDESENVLATLNAIEAYTLTLLKYCESSSEEDAENLNCLMASLGYFISNAIKAIQNPETKLQHFEAAVQLLNVTLRNIRKLSTHEIFKQKDKLFAEIWQALKLRLSVVFDGQNNCCLDDISVTVKFLSELCSVDMFSAQIALDLANLMSLKAPTAILKESGNTTVTSHRTAKYLWTSILKANIIGPKSAALSKSMFRTSKNIVLWIRTHFDSRSVIDQSEWNDEITCSVTEKNVVIDDVFCELLAIDMDSLTEVIVNAKKITLSPRFLDSIFELHQSIRTVLAQEMSVDSFLRLLDSSVASLNSLPLHRHELLEDRWPCYLQCYRSLVSCLSTRAAPDLKLDRATEEKFSESAHSFEKLTQAICRHKSQISRLAAYLVADFCSVLERTVPSRIVRQHFENCVVLLIQASESTYAAAFLRRALAGNAGQMTMTNLYTMYKRYHKYVGTS